MAGEELRHRLGVGVLPLHAEGEGLDPAHEEIGREGIDDGAGDALERPHRPHEVA